MKPEPFRIEPIFSPRIWGARSLAPLFPEKTNLKEPLGEAWLTGVDCCVASGPFGGKSLGAAWDEMSADWRGERFPAGSPFPLLLKFLFPTEKLSIQVHPNDAYAQAREKAAGGRGKTEMWHVVSAQTKAQVLVGLKPGVNRDKFLEGLERNKLEELFEAYPVYAGDTLFVPAGTPHTIGPGMVICEIQEYSDLTYRVYDYGRLDPQGQPRELHIEKALEVTRFGKSLGGKVAPLQLENEGATKRLLAACRYFATERWECSARCEICIDPARFELVVILNGSGALSWQGGSARFQRGECWIVPASQRNLALLPEGSSTLVRSYVPDVAVLRAELHRAGISAAALSQVVFD